MMKENELTADPNTDKVGEIGGRVTLTSRELRLLELVSYGYANADIAGHFQITQQAVKNMLRTIHLKLGADNRAHAVSICFRNGWLRSDSSGGPNPRNSLPFALPPDFRSPDDGTATAQLTLSAMLADW